MHQPDSLLCSYWEYQDGEKDTKALKSAGYIVQLKKKGSKGNMHSMNDIHFLSKRMCV